MKTLGFIVSPIAGVGENKISKRGAFSTVNRWQYEKTIAKIQGKLRGGKRGANLYVGDMPEDCEDEDMFCLQNHWWRAELFTGLRRYLDGI